MIQLSVSILLVAFCAWHAEASDDKPCDNNGGESKHADILLPSSAQLTSEFGRSVLPPFCGSQSPQIAEGASLLAPLGFQPYTLLMDRGIVFPTTEITEAKIIFNEPSQYIFEARLQHLIDFIDAGHIFEGLSHLNITPDFTFIPKKNEDLVMYFLNCAFALVNRIESLKTVTVDYSQRVLFMVIEPTAPLGQNVFPIADDEYNFSTRIKSLYADGWNWNIAIPRLPHLKRIQFISGRFDSGFRLQIVVSEHMKVINLECPDAIIALDWDQQTLCLQQFSVHGDLEFVNRDLIYAIIQSDALQTLGLRHTGNILSMRLEPVDVQNLTRLSTIRVSCVEFNFPDVLPVFLGLSVLEREDILFGSFHFTNVDGNERDLIALLVLSDEYRVRFIHPALVSTSFVIRSEDGINDVIGMANAAVSLQELTLKLYFPEKSTVTTVNLSNSNIRSLKVIGSRFSTVNIAITHPLKTLSLVSGGIYPTLPVTENLYLEEVTISSFRSLANTGNLALLGVQIQSFSDDDRVHVELCRIMYAAFSACSASLPDVVFEKAYFTTLTDIFSVSELARGRLSTVHVVTNVSSIIIDTTIGKLMKIDVEDHVHAIVIHIDRSLRPLRYRIFVGNTEHLSYPFAFLYPRGRTAQINANIRKFLTE